MTSTLINERASPVRTARIMRRLNTPVNQLTEHSYRWTHHPDHARCALSVI